VLDHPRKLPHISLRLVLQWYVFFKDINFKCTVHMDATHVCSWQLCSHSLCPVILSCAGQRYRIQNRSGSLALLCTLTCYDHSSLTSYHWETCPSQIKPAYIEVSSCGRRFQVECPSMGVSFFSRCLSMIGRRPSSSMSTACVVTLRRNWAIFCHDSERIGKVWSAREKSLTILRRDRELNPGHGEDRQ